MKLIGLTGNIASGKSTVARLLVACGAAHLDADHLVHELYRPGTDVTGAIATRFGEEVLAADGSVDRNALGRIVFGDPDAMRDLEQIVHPQTGRAIEARIREMTAREDPPPAMVIEAVKLIESGRHERVDEVWFVVARPAVQKQRLVHERGLSEEEAESRLAAQPSIEDRLPYADAIIENNGTMESLAQQVRDRWRQLMSIK